MARYDVSVPRRTALTAVFGGAMYGLGFATPGFLRLLERDVFAPALQAVIPDQPYWTGMTFGRSLVRLVDGGVIAPEKIDRHFARRGGLPAWAAQALRAASPEAIVLSAATAPVLLILLWALGLANRMDANRRGPLAGADGARFASTGGWRLGRGASGGRYFNSVAALPLSPDQERTVRRVADNTYRPCCDNSAFFQDCNHGSAMLGLIELAVGHDLPEDEIWQLAKVANGLWYPQQYVELAIWFREYEGKDWATVEPQRVLGAEFSSLSGWRRRVHQRLVADGLVAEARPPQGSGCAA